MLVRTLMLAAMLVTLISTSVQARSFTDAAGRVIDIPDTITTVLTAGPPAETLIVTLAPDMLAGWVRQPSEAALALLPEGVRDLPVYGRLTGDGGSANMEAVLAARPDLIIDVGTVNDTYISLADQVQAQTGIPYILIDGSFAQTADTYRLLGELLGEEARAELLATYAETTLADIAEAHETLPGRERPRVYYGRGEDGLETGLATSINLELLAFAGAVNVAAAAGPGGITPVSLEQVLDWNPDAIIAARASFAEAVRTDPSWAGITAVQAGDVYVAPSLPYGWFDTPPGVNRLIGLRWLQALFYPDSVTMPLETQVREFYALFYGVTLDDAQTAALLDGAL